MKFEREALTLKDMRQGKWNRKKALRVVAPRAEKFFDCGPMSKLACLSKDGGNNHEN